MTILDFDELNSFAEFKDKLTAMPVSEVMEKKNEIRDEVGWLLEFAYMLGFDRASEELGVLAEDFVPYLPTDYVGAIGSRNGAIGSSDSTKTGSYSTSGGTTNGGFSTSRGSDSSSGGRNSTSGKKTLSDILPKDYDQRMRESVYREIEGKNFADRVIEHAEMGDKNAILRVVETDGNRVYNSGGLLGARGKAKFKTWETQLDDRVRETHDYLQSVTVPIDEDFYTFDGDHAPQPGMFERVESNAGCRCYLTFSR